MARVGLGLTYQQRPGPADPRTPGLVVKRVRAGSVCDGQIFEGDVVVAIDGTPLLEVTDSELSRLSLGPAGVEVCACACECVCRSVCICVCV